MENWTICVGFLVMFCQPPEHKVATDSYCQISKPIYWNSSDTRKTKEQVDTHNRVWKKLCQQTSALK